MIYRIFSEKSHIKKELKLKANEEKTRMESITRGITFLGFQIKEKTSKRQKQYLSIEPSKDAQKKIKGKGKTMTKRTSIVSTEETIQRINSAIRGWQQYFDNISMGKTRNKEVIYHTSNKNVARRIKRK